LLLTKKDNYEKSRLSPLTGQSNFKSLGDDDDPVLHCSKLCVNNLSETILFVMWTYLNPSANPIFDVACS